MPIGTTRKPQTLTRKNATPSPLSQGFSQAPSPQGLMGLTNHINGLVAQSQQQFQAGRNQSPVNWRYPTRSPLVRNPIANRQSWLADQASTILAMQQAEEAGLGDIIPRGWGEMPFFAVRNRPEDVMAKFMATHVDGLRDKALSRVPVGPLTLKTPGGQMQQQMGYIDGQGQMTATNRLGALRHLAMQNPNDADVMVALAAAENDFKAQMADRSSPATVAANREKIRARNDAKRARAQRQAEGLRSLFGRGPQSPLSRRQLPNQQGLQSPLAGPGSRTVEAQVQSAKQIAARGTSPHFLGADMSGGSEGKGHLRDLNSKIQERLAADPNAEFSDETLKAWQQQAQDFHRVRDTNNDPFAFGERLVDSADSQDWQELATLPDNPRARSDWFARYKNRERFNKMQGDINDMTASQGFGVMGF